MIPEKLIQSDKIKSANVNLQELKKQIQAEKAQGKKEETADVEAVVEAVNEVTIKKVTHKKYGTGKVLKEDDMMIEVEFENYGVKEFIKAFSELEFL